MPLGSKMVPSRGRHGKNIKNLLRNHKAQSFYILYVAMCSGPLYKSCQMCPGSIQAQPSGRHGKSIKKSSSPKPQGPELSYFVCSNIIVVLFINPANCAPGVKNGPAPGASWEKHKTNLLQNHKAQSFHILCVAMFSGPPWGRHVLP